MATPLNIGAVQSNADGTIRTIPNNAAAALVSAMRPVTRAQYDEILPELRARVFVITGVEDLRVVEKVRDIVAQVPQGVDWKDAKDAIAQELEADLGEEGAARRAGVLLRHHVNQVYQAGRKRALDAQKKIFTHWEYMTTGDENVRDSHRELDGLILPADDPFWDTHFPPWEFGCRCRVRGLLKEEVMDIEAEDEGKAPEDQRVVKGARLDKLRQRNILDKGPGKQIDITPPSNMEPEKYRTRVQDFAIPLDKALEQHPPEVRARFEAWARKQTLPLPAGGERTLWDFLEERGKGSA